MSTFTRKKWNEIHDRLYAVYGDCVCPLRHESPFQLLAAVMLSAQCRDERVNQVTEKLFAAAPDAESMAKLSVDEITDMIRTCGLFAAKSRNLHAAARMIVEEFHGEVPRTMEELTRLPGIGRKSANVLLGNAFNTPGFPVDTHVNRLLNRIGAVCDYDPVRIESAACAMIDPEKWCNFSHLLIQHGRQVCHARKPECAGCVLATLCQKHGVADK
ncbi:MAG: endonuclease III [Lentisphaeria bacterium]|nr:endonuclease III [Lentisphaeria bacterium]